MASPTMIERIHKLEDEFKTINRTSTMERLINRFNKNPTEPNYNNLVNYLNDSIDLEYQYLNDSVSDIYLLDKNCKILVSYVIGTFSSFDDYINGLNFFNISEEQEMLNQYDELNKNKYVSVNLLEEPIANLIVNIIDNPNGLLYYLTATQSRQCTNYSLVGFVYKNITI